MGARLSALIVNYGSGGMACALGRSLLLQWRELGGAAEDLELAVVDNASPGDQSQALGELVSLGARVLWSRENLGYAAGMNLALEHTHGAADDWVLVLNPDLGLFPGALARLLETARGSRSLGAVGPRAYLDPARNWLMPPNRLPTPESEWLGARALHDGALAERLSEERTRHALTQWTARESCPVEMLSGACLLLPRAAIAAAGGLFDGRYPLYFEDTDLCRRLAGAGLDLILEPRAEIVHHWARSSGVEQADPEPARRHGLARAAYFERWFGPGARRPLDAADACLANPGPDPGARFEAAGACTAPPEWGFPRHGRWLVEVAMAPLFPLAAGALVEGAAWRMDPRAWEWFYRGRYFVQAVDPLSLRVARAWSFEKLSPSRTQPLAPEELLPGELLPGAQAAAPEQGGPR